ncbi:MAG: branched-chain amino acid aminotransferase [Chromatiaceae bacterium]|nr:branched-chain amino acid aminotransferase [Chromatiaceae bacterium]
MTTMADRDGLIWLDGELVPWREAKTHVLTHTLHYGMGVFEGVRAYRTQKGTAIFRLREHTDRLFNSAHILGMRIPWDRETLNQAQCTVVRENGLESAYIRPMCFYGAEGMGLRADNLNVHAVVAAWSWGAYLGEDNMRNGIRVRDSMLALQEALRDGYDEALLLDAEGYVMEGSGENIFVVREGVIYTPDLTSALDGITRKTVFTLATELGIPVLEKRITRDEVYIADEAFFTGTAAEVTPIREVDGRRIGSGTRGPITERLQSLYFDQVHGRRDEHAEWLTLV